METSIYIKVHPNAGKDVLVSTAPGRFARPPGPTFMRAGAGGSHARRAGEAWISSPAMDAFR